MCRAAEKGETGVLLAATGRGKLVLPGFQGALGLDPVGLFLMDAGVFGSFGYLSLDLLVPVTPALAGARIFFQDAVFTLSGGKVKGAFSNVQALKIR